MQVDPRTFATPRRRRRRVAWAVSAWLLAGCATAPAPAPTSGSSGGASSEPSPAPSGGGAGARARGGGDEIVCTIGEFALSRDELARRVIAKVGPRAIRSEIVADELVRQEAARRGITVSADELDRAVQRFIDGMAEQRGGVEKLRGEYERRGMSLEDLRADLAPNLRGQILRVELARRSRVIGERDLREYYDLTYKQKQYVARHIAFSYLPPGESPDSPTARADSKRKLEALERARRVVERVRKGADFARIARMESDDRMTAPLGGSLGRITENSPLPTEFKEAIFSLRPGEVSEPVENPRAPGIHVFFVESILPAEGFDECAKKLEKELREREPTPEEISRLLEALRARVKVHWSEAGWP